MDNQARALEADACTSKKSDEKEVVVAGASSHSCNGQTSECGKLQRYCGQLDSLLKRDRPMSRTAEVDL